LLEHHFLVRVRLDRSRVPSFRGYPFALPAVRHLDELMMHPHVTFFVGENGTGKSTLLEAIAVAWGFNAEGGSRNFRFETRGSHSPLEESLRLQRGLRRARDGVFLRAESFYNVATEIERLDSDPGRMGPPIIDSYGGRSLHEMSHGESFLTLLMERFHGDGLYLLDEPESALSPMRQLAMLVRIHDLAEAGAQFVIATHSPILLAYPRATIYAFDDDGIRSVEYEDTEHFQVSRRFLTDPEGMLRRLLGEAEDA
jgi:predicted ATPase